MSNQLYREQFMEVFKSGANFGKLSNPTLSAKLANPFCGDTILLELVIKKEKVTNVKFSGVACAVSKTASSIITSEIKGKTLAQIRKLTEKDILDLIDFELTSSRKSCALLCYHALQKALLEYDSKKSR